MFPPRTLAVFAAFLAVTAAVSGDSAVRSHQWIKVQSDAPEDAVVQVIFAVKTGTPMSALAEQCDAVSTPSSPTYGKYMDLQQLTALLDADAHAAAVRTALDDHPEVDVRSVQAVATGDFLVVTMPVKSVKALFSVPAMAVYRHGSTFMTRSVDRHTMPAALAEHVDLVLGVSDFPPVPRNSAEPAQPSAAALSMPDITGPYFIVTIAAVGDTTGYLYLLPQNNARLSDYPEWTVGVAVDGGAFTNYTASVPHMLSNSQIVFEMPPGSVKGGFHRYMIRPYAAMSNGDTVPVYAPLQPSALAAIGEGIAATPFVTPSYLKKFYNITGDGIDARVEANSNAVAEFGGEDLLLQDLEHFLESFGINATRTLTVHGPNSNVSGIESAMDIEIINAVAPAVDSTFWSVAYGSSLNNSWVLEWAMELSNTTSPPLVTSISYGLPEDQLVMYFDDQYSARFNSEMVKACIRGLTVVVCSQDAGSTDYNHGADSCAIHPVFPATSPYVLSVSSTLAAAPGNGVVSRKTTDAGESLVSIRNGCLWTTGGGFSALNPRPAYQNAAVSAYLKSDTSFPSNFSRDGRAYPDISALGRNYPIVVNGEKLYYGDGTSVSTPVISGMLSLLNNKLLASGKPQLGFVNPLLYSLFEKAPDLFYDVVVGETSCGAFACCPLDLGFHTAPGFDAASGLGTVADFHALMQTIV